MIRPELKREMRRWREALVGGAVLLLGLWWGLGSGGMLQWIGFVLIAGGVALIVAGIQKGRFRGATDGPGVVKIREGQIAYFGPYTGGAVALTELHRLGLDPTLDPPSWRLCQHGQPDLLIPLNAEGSEALFDIFAALPDIRTGRLVSEVRRASAGEGTACVVIWDRARLRLN